MNTLSYPIDNGLISGDGLTQLLAKFLSGSGVVETNALKVVPLPSADMKVRIPGSTNSDHLVVKKSGGGYLVGWNLENFDLTIDPNTTGVTKTDAVVAYFDLTAGSISVPEAPNGLTFRTVRRPLAETGSVDDSQIDTVVGHTNWHRLADVPVIHNATAISGGIIDTRGRAILDGSMLKELSIDTPQVKAKAITAAKLGDVVTTSQINFALNAAQVTSLTVVQRTGTTGNGVYNIAGVVDISSLSIPSTAKILNASFWVVGVGNTNNMGAVACAIQALTYNSVTLQCQIAGNDTGFPNQTNSKIQGYVRYIA